ncbi:MAG: hypothetical protein ACYC9I_01060 [Desulfuromonadales bacterium]
MRAFIYPALLLLTLAMFGCSDGSSDAPAPDAVHPPRWLEQHGAEARTTPNFVQCALCHGADLRGQGSVPSCFSVSFNGQVCHPGGPGAPHPLDGSYLSGTAHGLQAKQDLTVCQSCHGEPGGPGSNPRFNRGIVAAGSQGCESCHGANLAHPSEWAGPNATFHYTAGNIQSSCTLCHGAGLNGAGAVGVSCLGCHDSVTSFTLDCTFCHGYPPAGAADLATPSGVAHRNTATITHDICVICHGAKENATGGYFSAVPAYALFDKSTDTPGDHWDGRINMNAETAYNQVNFGCDTAVCHGNDAAHQLTDSQLPVALGNYGSGAGAIPHAIPFLDSALHGPAAKGLTAAFPNGLLDCQPCHASAPVGTDPPRFNRGIAAVGGVGCEGCHNDRTAHPSSVEPPDPPGRESQPWYNGGFRHNNARGFTTQCALCHGASLEGVAGISPACTSCHVVSPVTNPAGCLSCHNLPPDNAAPAGNVRPNRSGGHGVGGHLLLSCRTCHNGATFGMATHFDFAAPATIQFNLVAPDTMTATSTGTNTTCTGVCHGATHSAEGWY